MRNTLLALVLATLVPVLFAEESVPAASVTPPTPAKPPEWSRPGAFEVVVEVVGAEKDRVAEVVAGFTGLRLDYALHLLKSLPVTVLRNSSEVRAREARAELEAVGAGAKLVEREEAEGSGHTGGPVVGSQSAEDIQPGGAAGSLSAAMKKLQAKERMRETASEASPVGPRHPVRPRTGMMLPTGERKAGGTSSR